MPFLSIDTLKREDIEGKKVIVRVDFNCPNVEFSTKNVHFEDVRIKDTLPTIAYLRSNLAKIILCSHLGRPNGKVDMKYTMKPIRNRLSELLETPVELASTCIGNDAVVLAENLKPGEVLLLENLRFYPEEENDDEKFAECLASLSDGIYVNEAFSCSHRAHASLHAITHHVTKKCGGFQMIREISYLSNIIKSPRRPLAVIIGGAKLSSKIPIILNLLHTCDKILLGGAMCFTFLKAQGMCIGGSLCEDNCMPIAKEIIAKAEKNGVKLLLPVDFLVSESFSCDSDNEVVDADFIPLNAIGMDIGPRTIHFFLGELQDCRTIFWNGKKKYFKNSIV
jgi:phosphoglycerate kinase